MNSKIEARIEAVKLALNVEGVTAENIIDVSTNIAAFIIGNVDLPDNYDANAMTNELMAKALSTITPYPRNDEKADTETTEKA